MPLNQGLRNSSPAQGGHWQDGWVAHLVGLRLQGIWVSWSWSVAGGALGWTEGTHPGHLKCVSLRASQEMGLKRTVEDGAGQRLT